MHNTVSISAETARHVLFHYGRDGGYRPGSFTLKLMEAIDAADIVHTARLHTAYPELVDAMTLAANERDGIARLDAIANSTATAAAEEVQPPTNLHTGATRVALNVERIHATGGHQVNIAALDADGTGHGHRLLGGKHYNQGTTTVIHGDLNADDANEIRNMLDAVFPPTA
ncbi:hypothetical protein OHA99_09270 [Streptomyces coelicoflavus]|uniref:hypothetical protein n=1 Tax=Streptomyces coelicoflavus TaxID=285562 RepID=UPI00324DDA05